MQLSPTASTKRSNRDPGQVHCFPTVEATSFDQEAYQFVDVGQVFYRLHCAECVPYRSIGKDEFGTLGEFFVKLFACKRVVGSTSISFNCFLDQLGSVFQIHFDRATDLFKAHGLDVGIENRFDPAHHFLNRNALNKFVRKFA